MQTTGPSGHQAVRALRRPPAEVAAPWTLHQDDWSLLRCQRSGPGDHVARKPPWPRDSSSVGAP
eukprot:13617386-Alexandrium_andersonii.AAC.1